MSFGGGCGARVGQARIGQAGVGQARVGGAGAGIRAILAADEDVGARRIGPLTFVVEAGKRANGVKYVGGADFHAWPLLDEILDNDADVLAAECVEACRANVTVEGVGVADAVKKADKVAPIPPEIFVFNEVDIGAAADLAFAAMAFEAGDGCDALSDFGLCSGVAATRGAGKLWRIQVVSRVALGLLSGFFGFVIVRAEPGHVLRVFWRKALLGAVKVETVGKSPVGFSG